MSRWIVLTVLAVLANLTLHAREHTTAEVAVFKAFLQCDAQFFTALASHSADLPTLKPWLRQTNGIGYIAVANRWDVEGQSIELNPTFQVSNIAFNEFVDEVTPLETKHQTPYYWGFNTDAPVAEVLKLVQSLLPKDSPLTPDGSTWARIDVLVQGQWVNVPNHASLKGLPATRSERALLLEQHEGGGTRVMCGLQALPLPAPVLKALRPDLP